MRNRKNLLVYKLLLMKTMLTKSVSRVNHRRMRKEVRRTIK